MNKAQKPRTVDAGPDIDLGGAFAKVFSMLPPDRKAYWANRLVSGKPAQKPAEEPGETPAPKAKRKVKVIRDENGAITGFEQD